ncbi:ClbS/DfsB family four-helix bundle protein [candidate division TA06 bacterium]|uniref:ClbS/DfsB family four-helix bundle protein n=1 Tax=candidate division TA06 bacterium TaxID=2250710 RepID=A0A523UPK0_UNCT6|nr:MAG: ClbS/DfsB family four-helix bundle protein [candidate division TA06 bacterium]
MENEELTEAWAKGRKLFFDSVEGLSEERASKPYSMGSWSVKDVVAHLVFWDEELLRSIEALMRGDRPAFLDQDWDSLNAREVARRKDQSLEEMLQDLEESGRGVKSLIASLDEGQLSLRRGQKWKTWDVTIEWLVSGNIGHDGHHARKIAAWRNSLRM